MALRVRTAATALVLGAALLFSLLGVVSSGASVKARGKVVSASLSNTSFTAAQAKTVKLVYKLSPASKHFAYLLSLKKGSKWLKVRSVSKTGSFKGSYRLTVKALFGSKAVRAGQYRVKLFADANSLSLKFKVIKVTPRPGAFGKTSPADGATSQPTDTSLSWEDSSDATGYEYCVDATNNNACDGFWVSASSSTGASPAGLVRDTTYYWQVRARNTRGATSADDGSWFSFRASAPLAGHWSGKTSSSSFNVDFHVLPDQANVSLFTFLYSFTIDSSCAPNGSVTDGIDRPVDSSSFSGSNLPLDFSGSFDSSTSAHGTVGVTSLYTLCDSPNEHFTGGPYSWTATWKDASQAS
ncbi:MAG: hypothetical protein ACYDHO_05120 [Gaiellaceae bacterium]